MKETIFQKLKTAYSSLGLGDTTLHALATTLDATGLVTDENVDAIVAAQKDFLESTQKSNDKRVTDALAKAKVEADKTVAEAVEKAKTEAEGKLRAETDKQVSELKAQLEAEAKAKTEAEKAAAEAKKAVAETKKSEDEPQSKTVVKSTSSDGIPDWYKAIMEAEKAKREAKALERKYAEEAEQKKQEAEAAKQAEAQSLFEKRLSEIFESNKKLVESINALQQKNEAYEKEKEITRRNNFIASKVKELGIPDWRTQEGFNIADDASDETISEYLGRIAGNIKNLTLPTQKTGVPTTDDGTVTKEVTDNLAASIVNKM